MKQWQAVESLLEKSSVRVSSLLLNFLTRINWKNSIRAIEFRKCPRTSSYFLPIDKATRFYWSQTASSRSTSRWESSRDREDRGSQQGAESVSGEVRRTTDEGSCYRRDRILGRFEVGFVADEIIPWNYTTRWYDITLTFVTSEGNCIGCFFFVRGLFSSTLDFWRLPFNNSRQ